MKIDAIADTHGSHEELRLEGGDILIVAGDFMTYGDLDEAVLFGAWLRRQPYTRKVVVAGNHDLAAQREPAALRQALDGAIYLCDESATVLGVRIYGSPWTPQFGEWAFMYRRGSGNIVWDQIPEDTELLVTHGPAYGTGLGMVPREDTGCWDLRQRIEALPKLQAHVCGHIHCSAGEYQLGNKWLYNVAVLDDNYAMSRPATRLRKF